MTTQELGEAVLKLTTDSTELDAGMDKAKEKTSGLTDTVKKLVTAYLSIETLKKVAQFFADSIEEYRQAEISLTRLNSAVKATGDLSSVTRVGLANYAAELQSTTRYTDEASQGALAMLMTIGQMTAAMAAQALPAVQDLASGLGIDLEQAATLVSKAMEGNVGALGRYGIHLKLGSDATANLATITGGLEKRFGGLALAMGDTASGKLTQLTNAFADIKEEIGRALLSAFEPFIAWLSNVTKGIANAMKAANDLREALKDEAKGIADTNDKLLIAQAKYKEAGDAVRQFNKDLTILAGGKESLLGQSGANAARAGMSIRDYGNYLNDAATKARLAMNDVERLASAEKKSAEEKAALIKKLADIEDARWAAEAKARNDAIDRLNVEGMVNATWDDVAISRLRLIHDAMQGVDEISNKTWEDVKRDVEAVTRAFYDMQPVVAAVSKTVEGMLPPIEYTAGQMGILANNVVVDWKAAFTEILTFTGNVFASLAAIAGLYYRNQQTLLDNRSKAEHTALDDWYNTQLAALGDMTNATQEQLDAKAKLDKDYADQKKALDDAAAARQKTESEAAWKAQHALSLSSAIMNTAQAVVNALANIPAPWNVAAAIADGLLGAVQIALIANEPMPAFAGGGDFVVPPGYPDDSYGIRVQSGEHVSVTPAGGEQQLHIVVNLDSQPILDAVTRGARNGRVLIRARSVVP